ncbi:MAG: NAD-dependent epimerase/dehydratase family protein [Candidatus Parvarchaeota archaeon]|nr:NAD-dependent epimerase/dehydratase family protein [Candidatus Jingweiarchaeum tengchongense]MCW1298650.1 NAD-dependent epimerase/dehydratase family protein [Candidatus Jingweiarchaeum tengchongense]MCW1300492.1 NAD-dependent epimerase/dehydratase family protein [Candidatus Jingweiarchaeum tengchongense]MCW1304693.1 NAD-dependent epimerase/dehydratase family protein [Candidatus Jingweiarchaeum tengchongense]MCW1305882.1 NAD-dependent epimerase/dehydratase family protein [Candidatus Jingweiar
MKVVVTGGAGFIGSHIVGELVRRNQEVIVIDNFHTGHKQNLSKFANKIKILEGRVFDAIKKNPDLKPDFIIHCGMPSSSPMYKENRNMVHKTIEDAITLFEFAKENGSKIVLTSSSSVYNGLPIAWKEEMKPIVSDFYTETRLAIERLAELYYKLHNVNTICLRLFSVYGPREEFKRNFANMISQTIWKVLKDERPVFYGDGNQTRDFIFVDDVVNAFIRSIDILNKKDVGFEIVNVGSGTNKSFNEILELINEKLNKDVKAIYVKNPIKNYVYHTLADTTKMERFLKFKPKIELERGIMETINYYKKLDRLPEI